MNHLRVEGCPFCDDAIAEDTFLESPHFRAAYNVSPILPGHSLILPKWHVNSFLSLSDEECCEMTLFSRQVVELLLPIFGAKAFNWTIQEGKAAGQTVPHMHLHLIPRLLSDLPAPGDWYPLLRDSQSENIDSAQRPRLSPEQRHEIVSRIREAAILHRWS